jgi:hypothetical protein
LVPAIKALVDRLTKQTVAAEVEPLKAQAKVTQTKAAQEATNAVMKTFDETHPGWKDVEDQMTALGAKIQPNGMDELEYLDMLYQHVTRDGQDQSREQTIEKEVAARLKKAVARLNEGAEDAETPTRSTPDRQVKTAPPPNAGFRDAYAAAKRGERWE